MAKSCAHTTEGNFTAGGTTNNTASISPAASSTLIFAVFAYGSTSMVLSGLGLTWTTVVNGVVTVDAGRFWIFSAPVGASPPTGVLTLTYDNDAFVNWFCDNITGTVSPSAPTNSNTANSTGTGTGVAGTLGAFSGASSGVWAYGYVIDSVTVTPGSGFTLVDSNSGTAMFGHTDFSEFIDSNDTSVDATLSAAQPWGLVAIEIVDSAGGGGGLTPASPLFTRPQNTLLRL